MKAFFSEKLPSANFDISSNFEDFCDFYRKPSIQEEKDIFMKLSQYVRKTYGHKERKGHPRIA